MSARLIIVFAGLVGIACPGWAATEPTPAAAFAANVTRDVSKLRLASANVLVFDTKSGHSIYAKGADTITPIASVTKLMTAMVVLDANQALDETISVGIADLDLLKGSHSRLRLGSELPRGEMLRLALMASETRAA
jgi:D-alanyl-D-alanine endopeptidase (penicillin-binding protein 7)